MTALSPKTGKLSSTERSPHRSAPRRQTDDGRPEPRISWAYLVATTLLTLAFLIVGVHASSASEFEFYKTFQTPDVFLAEMFNNAPPVPSVLQLDAKAQDELRKVFNRPFPQSRVRYWRSGNRTAWIFDDIGKEGYVPTTCGFLIKDGIVEVSRVLIYRESRGEQVAEPSFLNQLAGARAAGTGLDREVDNISGATLSVRMMQRMARTAITLDSLTH